MLYRLGHESGRRGDERRRRGAASPYNGAGVKVGVISDSANMVGGGLAASQGTGDLPGTIDMLRDGPPGYSSDEGRAMMEIVHDVARGPVWPSAAHSGANSTLPAGFMSWRLRGRTSSSTTSIYYAEPAFADGPIAQAVDHVVDTHGVAYFSAAGNQADKSYESVFRDADPANWSTSPRLRGDGQLSRLRSGVDCRYDAPGHADPTTDPHAAVGSALVHRR